MIKCSEKVTIQIVCETFLYEIISIFNYIYIIIVLLIQYIREKKKENILHKYPIENWEIKRVIWLNSRY